MLFLCTPWLILGQVVGTIQGSVVTENNTNDFSQVRILVNTEYISVNFNSTGAFSFSLSPNKLNRVRFELEGYFPVEMELQLTALETRDLGAVIFRLDVAEEQRLNLVSLSASQLADEQFTEGSSSLLQATRDVFLNKAAFEFSQAFFKVRGYASSQARVLLQGIAMNKLYNDAPQWNNWGGLNDVTRNQEFTRGLQANDFEFGGLLGVTNINLDPSTFRSGLRVSSSLTNRTYRNRFMVTYTGAALNGNLSYSVSGSTRWAKEGYTKGTVYDSFSLFGAVSYGLSERHKIQATVMIADNRRGKSAAITDEVYSLTGAGYNPYWGLQNERIRNSRERHIREPLFIMSHSYQGEQLSSNLSLAYQTGFLKQSRLGYANAPNPDPTYYRYLPSFYINSPIGANFDNASLARDAFLTQPQIDWDKLYSVNKNQENAAYYLYNDVSNDKLYSLGWRMKYKPNANVKFNWGLQAKQLQSSNYAEIKDLLGANTLLDEDPFSNTLNAIERNPLRVLGDRFQYDYSIKTQDVEAFFQTEYQTNKWSVFFAVAQGKRKHQRVGQVTNERFLTSSKGESDALSFSSFSVKMGGEYKLSARHWLQLHLAKKEAPPAIQHMFVNPRENNQYVNQSVLGMATAASLTYHMRLPKLTTRFSIYGTDFLNGTDVNYFFVDAGIGSDFVQEVVTNIATRHYGVELGASYDLSPDFTLTTALALGSHKYNNIPNSVINFDASGDEDDLISTSGNVDLVGSQVKEYRLGQGPQTAFSFGLSYRNPKYWWASLSANYMANAYAHISTINRTDSFTLNPETGSPFLEATPENVSRLLAQKPLPEVYLLNLIGGKSWLKKGRYMSVFMSINNIFNSTFKTGGYEQQRNGNFGQLYQDELSGTPSFGTKHWYGFGRTFFLNFAISI